MLSETHFVVFLLSPSRDPLCNVCPFLPPMEGEGLASVYEQRHHQQGQPYDGSVFIQRHTSPLGLSMSGACNSNCRKMALHLVCPGWNRANNRAAEAPIYSCIIPGGKDHDEDAAAFRQRTVRGRGLAEIIGQTEANMSPCCC